MTSNRVEHNEDLLASRPLGRRTHVIGERAIATDWMDEAACADSELDFVPDRPAGGIAESALPPLLAVCDGCPVKAECLEYALEQTHSQRYGVYGGTTPDERRELARTA